MTKLNIDYFIRCIATLERAFNALKEQPDDSDLYDIYRDNRNSTAHDYGVSFADETLTLLPQFILDAIQISNVIKNQP